MEFVGRVQELKILHKLLHSFTAATQTEAQRLDVVLVMLEELEHVLGGDLQI